MSAIKGTEKYLTSQTDINDYLSILKELQTNYRKSSVAITQSECFRFRDRILLEKSKITISEYKTKNPDCVFYVEAVLYDGSRHSWVHVDDIQKRRNYLLENGYSTDHEVFQKTNITDIHTRAGK